MNRSRKLTRRSFFAAVIGGGLVTGGAAAFVVGRSGTIASGNGVTDSDTGQLADVAANGRGTPRGYTDSDLAPVRDAEAAGRGPGARSEGLPAAAQRERASSAATIRAPAGNGCSDADVGAVADAGGRGRACANTRS